MIGLCTLLSFHSWGGIGESEIEPALRQSLARAMPSSGSIRRFATNEEAW